MMFPLLAGVPLVPGTGLVNSCRVQSTTGSKRTTSYLHIHTDKGATLVSFVQMNDKEEAGRRSKLNQMATHTPTPLRKFSQPSLLSSVSHGCCHVIIVHSDSVKCCNHTPLCRRPWKPAEPKPQQRAADIIVY